MMKRPDLFSLSLQPSTFRTQVISRRRDFEALFEGFPSLRAISYVASPSLLLEFLTKRGYTKLEVVVGENLADTYRQSLAEGAREVVEQLVDCIEDGALTIYVPNRTVHTKLYILTAPQTVRVIQTSANLTETARQATRQVNYAWYADLAPNDPWLLETVYADYQSHLKLCTPFMGELIELLRQHPASDRSTLIDAWLRGGLAEDKDAETRQVLQEMADQALSSLRAQTEPVFSVRLPASSHTRKQLDRLLAPLNPDQTREQISLNGARYIRHVQENTGVPLLRVDLKRQEAILGINGSAVSVTEPLPDASTVNRALEHLEAYVNTVDWGRTSDPQLTKTSMYEALIYVLSAPFAHEYMKLRRSRYGMLDARGPQFLYIFGPSQNGKTTFLRFALRLLTGQHMLPLPGIDFTKTKIQATASFGTAFPLMFDDVLPSQNRSIEGVLKSYWEVWWKEELVSPQIVLSSNTETLKEWAKSRVKRIDFDILFPADEQNKEQLAAIFSQDNPIFKWFTVLYLRQLRNPPPLKNDELYLARNVMVDLHAHAKRRLPPFFPREPVERISDPGRKAWREVVYVLKKAQLRRTGNSMHIVFDNDLQSREVQIYEGYLPQTVKARKRGNMLIVENPADFDEWLGKPPADWREQVKRVFSRVQGM